MKNIFHPVPQTLAVYFNLARAVRCTRVPGQGALRAVGRALVQWVLEGSVVIDGGSVVVRRSGFLVQLAVLAIGALQAYVTSRDLQSEKHFQVQTQHHNHAFHHTLFNNNKPNKKNSVFEEGPVPFISTTLFMSPSRVIY